MTPRRQLSDLILDIAGAFQTASADLVGLRTRSVQVVLPIELAATRTGGGAVLYGDVSRTRLSSDFNPVAHRFSITWAEGDAP